MIQSLGIKRILVLIVLVAANAALAAGAYLYVVPEQEQVARQLKMTVSEIASKKSEVNRLRNEFDEIQKQKEFYGRLQDAGFMSNQNRLVARRRITEIQKYSKVLKVGYDISPADVEYRKETGDVNYVVLSSPIKAEIEALDDIDIYAFIFWMENAFPGHVAATKLELTRTLDINDATLRAIGSGSFPTMVKGSVGFRWRTIVPEAEVKATDRFSSEGF